VRSVAERVQATIADKLGVETDVVTPRARLIEDLSADSLDLADLFMGLSEEFDVPIPPDECEALETVRDVVRYLRGKGVDG